MDIGRGVRGLQLLLAPMAIPYVGWVFGWFISPLAWLIVASAYAQIIESQKLPLSDGEVAPSV